MTQKISKIFQFTILILLLLKILCDINIHIVPHTHLDPGWLKTPEEYYNDEAIDKIFYTVLYELSNTTKTQKTFVINELYYFKIWYEKLNQTEKNQFKKLIEEKKIEFVSGSYVINDEATPLYYNIMDQIRIGLQFLYEEFHIKPKTAWYIDSFGHSAGNAYILSQLNYDNIIMGRMHEDFLSLMKENKMTEFYWEPFGKNSNDKKILTHILPLHYGYELFHIEMGFLHEEFKENIENILNTFINNLKDAMKGLKHNNILFLYGDDFKHKDNNLFLNMDLIKNIFENETKKEEIRQNFGTEENINLFYSTPEKYFEYMEKELAEKGLKLDSYTNLDFFPLRSNCFWTGYFTSRPFLKGFIRKASNIFYSFSKYYSYNRLSNQNINKNIISNLNDLREVVGLNQHHDAITGTCMQYVATDYLNRLRNGIFQVEKEFIDSFEKKYNIKIKKICYNNYLADDGNCFNNFVMTNSKSGEEIKIGLFNPISIYSDNEDSNKLLINIEIVSSDYEYEIEGIKTDFICINRDNINEIELFKYDNKCFLNFFYEFKKGEELIYLTLKNTLKKINNNNYMKFSVDKDDKIELIKNDINIQSLIFNPKKFEFNLEYFNEDEKINKITFTYYDGMYYVNSGNCVDGAYIFSPYNKYPDEIKVDFSNSFYYKGNLGITFLTRNIDTSFTMFTLFYNPFFVKVDHFFDNLDKSYFLNRFSFGYSFVLKTDINNLDKDKKPIFYTDANGLEMMKRTIDKFVYKETEPDSTASNFYPVTSFISIQDENNKNKVTVFNDRPQAGTGYLPGSIILILQRKTYGSDQKGLEENLYETESMSNNRFRTTHFIIFGLNINKNKDKNKYIIQKTDLLNFVYNYMNTGIFMFKINKDTLDAKKKFEENNELKNKMINNCLTISPDIRVNYEIINNNLIIGEYFRYNNYYFDYENNSKNDDKSFGKILINFDYDIKFKIYIDKNGINYLNKGTKILENTIKLKLSVPKKKTLSVNPNEYIFIYFYFDN